MGFKEVLSMATKDKKKMFGLMILVVIAIFLLIVSQMLGSSSPQEEDASAATGTPTVNSGDVCREVERGLAETLSKIEGAGEVSVIIKWHSSTVREYAYNEDDTTRNDGEAMDTGTKREMVLLGGNKTPVVIREILPEIEGVLIVASGGHRAEIREELANAAAIYFNVGAHKIQVSQREVAK